MKILILNGFFLLCSCFSNVLISQTFNGLAQGSTWIHEWDNSAWGGNPSFQEITIGADTIINSQIYYKITSHFYNGSINYMGAIRNDTVGKQVVIVPKDSVNDYKLYDYGVNVGDTVYNVYFNTKISAVDGVISDFRIVDIDSFMINSVYYNRYTIENLNTPPGTQDYWYEGFGSTDGILGSGAWEELSSFKWLICCNVNGTTYKHEFPSSPPTIIESSSNCILNIVDIEEEGAFISIYPNPSNGELYISMSEKLQSSGLYQLEIYSVEGEQLINSLYKKNTGGLIKVDVNSLPPGIYLLHVVSNDGMVRSHKIVKR